MKITNLFWIPQKWKITEEPFKIRPIHLKLNFKFFSKWPVVWKNITLKVLNYQLVLARLKAQYGIYNKIVQRFQNKMMCAFFTLVITFKLTFETDLLKSFRHKKPLAWTFKEKLRLINELNFTDYKNFKVKHLKIKYKLIQQLLELAFKPLTFVRKKFFYNKSKNFHLFIDLFLMTSLSLNSFPIWNTYLEKCKKFAWVFNDSLIINYTFQLLVFNQIVYSLSQKILKNLLWFTSKIKLTLGWTQKTKKHEKILSSRIYYFLHLKYSIIFFFNYFIISFKNILFVRLLIDYKLWRFILENMRVKKINSSKNRIYKKFFEKQTMVIKKKLRFFFYSKFFKFKSIFSVNKFIWNFYKLLKRSVYRINWKKLDLYLYGTYLRETNKKNLNSFTIQIFWFKNLKLSKKGIYGMTFKNLYL